MLAASVYVQWKIVYREAVKRPGRFMQLLDRLFGALSALLPVCCHCLDHKGEWFLSGKSVMLECVRLLIETSQERLR